MGDRMEKITYNYTSEIWFGHIWDIWEFNNGFRYIHISSASQKSHQKTKNQMKVITNEKVWYAENSSQILDKSR